MWGWRAQLDRIEANQLALISAIKALLISKNDEAALLQAASALDKETAALKHAVEAAQPRR